MLALFIVFAMFLSATLIAWWVWERGRAAELTKIKKRLATTGEPKERASAKLIRSEEQPEEKLVLRILHRLKLSTRTRTLIEQAGLKWAVSRLLHGSLALLLGGFSAVWYLLPAWRILAVPVAALTGSLPLLYLLKKRRARLRKFESLFPESLEFLSRSMRAGHAFSVSLEMIHSEFQEPLAGEFRRAFDEQNLGLPLEVALENLGTRVPSMDVHFFVSAVILQKRTGGNLAELLDKLATLIRERFKLRGRIRAISAHGRMTGMVLSAIPAAVGLIMCYVNPDYGRFFVDDQTGQMMLGGAVAMQMIGYAVIKKIISIEV